MKLADITSWPQAFAAASVAFSIAAIAIVAMIAIAKAGKE